MSTFVITIIIFILAGVVNSATRRNQPPTGRSRVPWFPLENVPNRRFKEPWQQLHPQVEEWEMQAAGSEDIDPGKDAELREAEGREGEWGDEGRPSQLRHETGSSNRAYQSSKGSNKRSSRQEQVPGAIDTMLAEPTPLSESAPFGEPGVELMFSSEQLVQAVVWSEILGKPRAMRKFKASRH